MIDVETIKKIPLNNQRQNAVVKEQKSKTFF